MHITRVMSKPFSILPLVLAAACGGDEASESFETAIARSCTATVAPSADDQTTVQAMFIAAKAGDTLCFGAGTYTLTDSLDLSNLSGIVIKGTGATPNAVVLDFQGQAAGAKGINLTSMTDVVVSNLTILDASGDNLFINGSTNVTIHKVRSGWVSRPIEARGRYALYPVSSTNVLITESETFGSSDAGFYVGQATNCIVRDSYAHDNVTGVEIENSTNCEVVRVKAENNTSGILVFELPGLPKRGQGTLVHDNMVLTNNTLNFAEEGAFVSLVPEGTGIMVLAGNDVDIANNTITGNITTGILVVSYDTVKFIGGPDVTDTAYDGFSERISIRGNTFGTNGLDPSAAVNLVTNLLDVDTLEDVLWDGFTQEGADAKTLCVAGAGTFRNIDVPGATAGTTTSAAAHNCTSYQRAPVELPQDPQ
jgi:parallel beta-helix repeat protein